MTMWLKQSTAATIKLGPFVDATDGVTAETALTISQADIRLAKNGGDVAQTNNAAGATHDENGYYDVPLDTTDTGTLGRLKVFVNESGALPVWQDFMVVPAMIYDSLIAGSDRLDANVTHIGDTAQTARDLGASVLLSSGTGTGQLDFTSGVVKSNLAQILGTALTETAGQIAAAFKKFFDKATPTGTINSLPDAVAGAASGLAIVGSNMGTTTSLTGDAYARLGAPAGASVSADIAAIKTDTGNLVTRVGTPSDLGGGATVAANLADIEAQTDDIGAAGAGLTAADDAILAAIAALNNLSAAQVNSEVDTALADYDGPTHAELTAALAAADDAVLAAIAALSIPTADENADALLDRDMSTGTDSGSATVRTVRQALRVLRNRVAIAAGTLTVYKENDATASWTGAVTTAAGDPISEVDPASS